MTYAQAFSKMEIAYLRGEVNAFDSQFCFCGNLCDNRWEWNSRTYSFFLEYSFDDFKRMEAVYMMPLIKLLNHKGVYSHCDWVKDYNTSGAYDKQYEDANYEGFVAALEVLAEIHRGRNEDVDLGFKLEKKVQKEYSK